MLDYDEINKRMEEEIEKSLEKKKQSKTGLFLKILAIPFILYMIFFVVVSMVLIFGSYHGN
jgi:hypothetical protein